MLAVFQFYFAQISVNKIKRISQNYCDPRSDEKII